MLFIKKFRKSQAGLPGLPAGTTKGKVLFEKMVFYNSLIEYFFELFV